MLDGGFQLSSNLAGRQPGQWFQTIDIDGIAVEIPVDLLIPEQFSGTGKSRRTAGDARVTGVRVRPPGTRAPQWRRNPGASCRTTSTSSYASDTR